MPAYTVAVRALCEFAAKQGDLDLRFTPSPSSQEGVAGHKVAAARRGAGYRAEVSLSGEYKQLVVRGRADGYHAAEQRLEEIKTFKGELDRMPANHRVLHWAQAKVYAHLLCRQFGLAELKVALVYFDVRHQRETSFEEDCDAATLQRFFEDLCERFLAWAEREIEHRQARDEALRALGFPHPSYRPGQRRLAESVFKAARLGRCLLAQAPTGIGKTMATIFPLLKACAVQELDKLFFLSAKGSGRALALDAIATLREGESALPLRVVELVAREKACEFPDKACHGDSCPLARSFYDRLPAARQAAVDVGTLTQAALRDIALAHQVCPYYLGQELARWSDVVVGDHNHYFDSSALLHELTLANPWRVAVLVDEAHNLVERARDMYSAALSQADVRALRSAAPPALKAPLNRLQRAWKALAAGQQEAYAVHAEVPPRFIAALQDCTAAIGEHFEAEPAGVADGLLRFYFDAVHFARLLESFASHSLFDLTLELPRKRSSNSTLCIRNVLPGVFLAPRFAAARAGVLFSATLAPWHFYADTLGLPQDCAWLDVEAPFKAEQLSVRVVRDVSTRFRDRGESLAPIADLMAAQFDAQPGNYLAFFSSFDYLQQAADAFTARHPQVPAWLQSPRMAAPERDAFLARFSADGCGIGFAVLGGLFAEGIDLPGRRLIGAFIATLGLPQFNAVNEAMRRRIEAELGSGYDYAYLFPGIRKVVQAAGRVIRTPSDRGSVHLIDDRFMRPEVRRLLPGWWSVKAMRARTPGLQRLDAPCASPVAR